MQRLRINPAGLALYLFGLVVVSLAGMSLAGVLLYIFYLYLLFPLFSFVLLLAVIIKFRYYENFSTEHPYKGENVSYTLLLANETPLSGAFVDVQFKLISPDASQHLQQLTTVVKRGQTRKETHTLTFPYRGIYKVGIDRIELYDVLRWFVFRPKVWFRTFYVYPRIVELKRVFPTLQNVVEASGQGQGVINDHTLFKALSEYRDGIPIRHIAWKKFASTGVPFLREYEKTSWPGVEIYLDLRREQEPHRRILEREDCSVEILTALVHYFLRHGVPTGVHAANGRERFDFSGDSPSYFSEFYRETISLSFEGDVSPAEVYQSDLRERLIRSGTIIIISHRPDAALLELALNAGRSELAVFLIINQSGLAQTEKEAQSKRIASLSGVGKNLVCVNTSNAIKESLEA